VATRLYWNNKILDWNNWSPSWPFNWNQTAGLTYRGYMMDTTKGGYPISSYDAFPNSAEPPPYTVAFYRGVTRQLLPQTISGTFDATFYCRQTTTAEECYTKVCIYVLDVTGSPFNPPVLGYLLQTYDERPGGPNAGTEWPISTQVQSRNLKAPVTLTSVTIPNDGREYRLVVEWGYVTVRATSVQVNSYTRLGSRGSDWVLSPDLTVSTTPDLFAASFCDFSANITFGTTKYLVNNYEPELAIDLGPAPVSLVVNPPSMLSTDPELTDRWYKYDGGIDTTISVLSCNTTPVGNDYNNLYTYPVKNVGTNGPPFKIGPTSAGGNAKRAVMVPMKGGAGIFFRLYINATTTLSLQVAPSNALAGDLVVNADNSLPSVIDPTMPAGNASVWWHPDGTISQAADKLPFSELGVVLANGRIGIPIQQLPHELFIIDKPPSLAVLSRNPLPDDKLGSVNSIATDFKFFYTTIGQYNGPQTVFKTSDQGITDPRTWTIQGSKGDGIKNSGVSRNGTVLYIVDNDTGNVYRHDLVNDVPLSPFSSGITNAYPNDIIVMSDNTVVSIFNPPSGADVLKHWAPDGTLLHTWSVGDSGYGTDHFTHEADDSPDKIWIWLQSSSNYKFQLMSIITGVILKEFITAKFSGSGTASTQNPACNPVRFGVGSSCTLFMMMTPAIAPTFSGIYQIVRGKTNDTVYQALSPVTKLDVKIPDPFVKTSLIGS
jgi:hypothetical protein